MRCRTPLCAALLPVGVGAGLLDLRLERVQQSDALPPVSELLQWSLAQVAWALVALALAVALHEAGHVLGAAATGLRVLHVRLGAGPRVLRLGRLEVRVLAWAGGATFVAEARGRRQRATLLVAGPLADLGLLLAALAWAPDGARLFLVVAAAVGLANLLPFSALGQHSDGRHLVRLVRRRPSRTTGAPLSPEVVAAALLAAGRGAESEAVLRRAGRSAS